jgi:GntR family transcriptional regulator / MocR family aminotransferase
MPTFGGTAYWVKGPDNLDANLLQEEARKQGILIEAGDIFFHQPDLHKHYFRLGYSSISEDKIDSGLKKLCEIIHKIA